MGRLGLSGPERSRTHRLSERESPRATMGDGAIVNVLEVLALILRNWRSKHTNLISSVKKVLEQRRATAMEARDENCAFESLWSSGDRNHRQSPEPSRRPMPKVAKSPSNVQHCSNLPFGSQAGCDRSRVERSAIRAPHRAYLIELFVVGSCDNARIEDTSGGGGGLATIVAVPNGREKLL